MGIRHIFLYRNGDIVKDPMNSRDVVPKNAPRVVWVIQVWGEVGHAGLGWLMQGWGGSCRGGVAHAGVGWDYVGVG